MSSLPGQHEQHEDPHEATQAATPARTAEPVATRAVERSATRAVIVAHGLSKHFTQAGEVIKAVDGVNFTVGAKQLVAITGPSGCGKTTLMYLLGNLEKPTSGTLRIDGIDVSGLRGHAEDEFRRTKVGFIFQSFNLIPDLTALENVMLPLEIRGTRHEDREARARTLLQRVGIDEKRYGHWPRKLSGGQQQRVAIARALANDPAVVLADEPTGNLDSKTGRHIVGLLVQLSHQGRTVVVVTHDRTIARLADQRMELEDGRIVSIKQNSNVAQPRASSAPSVRNR
jgi:ABC-type lipoprotein export system ATPase subunit